MFKKSDTRFLTYAIIAAFGTYFCMYAFRKPFTVATYEGEHFWGVDYKIALIIAQVLGYMLSKFLGIRLISELKNIRRALYILTLIGLAEISLIFFAVVPAPYNIVFMFFNGLPLGLIWGIVFSYLEGRRLTEFLGLALCSSFIVSSGVVKSIGLSVMLWFGVGEFWMPAVTGAIFLLPLLFFTRLLEKIPGPTSGDIRLRNERIPMTRADRKQVLRMFWFPLVVLVFFYTFLTAFRDFRDNFSRELWDALGFQGDASVYTLAELPVAFLVLGILSLMGLVRDNFKAFTGYHYLLLTGVTAIGLGTFLFQLKILGPWLWMVVVGFGLYLAYVPFNCIFFDRMVAAFRTRGNAGYLIYIADSFGYLGSILVLLYKNFGQAGISWMSFFIYGSYGIAVLGGMAVLSSLAYFKYRQKQTKDIHLHNLHLHGKEI